MDASRRLAVERRGDVLLVGLDRPEKHNALDEQAVDELRAVTLAETVAKRSWRALELTKLSLRASTPDTTSFDITAQALLFDSQDKHDRMSRFLERRERR